MSILYYCQWDNARDWWDALRAALPEEEFVWYPDIDDGNGVEFAIVWNLPHGLWPRFPNLKAAFSLGAGVDHFLQDPGIPKDLAIGRLIDPLMGERMAEYVLGRVLYHHLQFQLYEEQAARIHWERHFCNDAKDKTVGVLGLGNLGAAVANKLAAVGFQVAGWSRSKKNLPGISCYSGKEGLSRLCEEADHLVNLMPLTRETENFFDRDFFAKMKPGAHFINCARGAHVVEEDLLQALDEGRLGWASLDVFRTEPLPQDHPFWRHPKVTVTPHISSLSDPDSGARALARQIIQIKKGERPEGAVDLARGY